MPSLFSTLTLSMLTAGGIARPTFSTNQGAPNAQGQGTGVIPAGMVTDHQAAGLDWSSISDTMGNARREAAVWKYDDAEFVDNADDLSESLRRRQGGSPAAGGSGGIQTTTQVDAPNPSPTPTLVGSGSGSGSGSGWGSGAGSGSGNGQTGSNVEDEGEATIKPVRRQAGSPAAGGSGSDSNGIATTTQLSNLATTVVAGGSNPLATLIDADVEDKGWIRPERRQAGSPAAGGSGGVQTTTQVDPPNPTATLVEGGSGSGSGSDSGSGNGQTGTVRARNAAVGYDLDEVDLESSAYHVRRQGVKQPTTNNGKSTPPQSGGIRVVASPQGQGTRPARLARDIDISDDLDESELTRSAEHVRRQGVKQPNNLGKPLPPQSGGIRVVASPQGQGTRPARLARRQGGVKQPSNNNIIKPPTPVKSGGIRVVARPQGQDVSA